MKRAIAIIAFGLLLLVNPHASAAKLEKVSGPLEYLYNSYYDPEYLQRYHDSLMSIKTIRTPEGAELISLADDITLKGYNPYDAPVHFVEGVPYIKRFIRYRGDGSDLRAVGATVRSHFSEDVALVEFPLSILPDIVSLPSVEQVCDGGRAQAQLDVSMPDIKADLVHQNLGYTGKGVVIGIIDQGIDIYNEDFRDSTGHTRIKYVWDQIDNVSPGSNPPEFSYGREWTGYQVDSTILGLGGTTVPHADTTGHGTHVTGIAAGNGNQTSPGYPSQRYVGVAPDADLIVVEVKLDSLGADARIYEALLYISIRAQMLGKPWVVNMSLGMLVYGAKNGTSSLETEMDNFVRFGDTTTYGIGRVIVTSAGNEGTVFSNPNHTPIRKWHASGQGTDSVYLDLICSPDSVSDTVLYFWDSADLVDLYIVYDAQDSYELTIHAPDYTPGYHHVYGPYPFGTHEGTYPGWPITWPNPISDGAIRVCHEIWGYPLYDPLAGGGHSDDYVIRMMFQDIFGPDQTFRHLREGIWTLEMTHLSGPGLPWDAYRLKSSPPDTLPKAFADSSYDNTRILTEPGTAHKIITVGSYNTKYSWNSPVGYQTANGYSLGDTTWFTSLGPTRDGRDKPELFAPGAWIMSSRSRFVTDTSVVLQ